MDSYTINRVALMSIHPNYAESIMRGTKTIEFRKRRLAADISTVIVYSTSPTKLIVGTFDIEETIAAEPRELWRTHGKYGDIPKGAFFEYFDGYSVGVGFRITRVRRLNSPVRLEALSPELVAPQSFLYLPEVVAIGLTCLPETCAV